MTSATLELYNALVDAGVDKDKAQSAASVVVMREEAAQFATRADIGELKADIANSKSDLQRFLFMALVGQAVFVIGMVITLIQVLS